MKDVLEAINLRVKDAFHLEFSILSYSKYTLTIVGSENLLYYHDFEIVFTNVFAVVCNSDWRIDTTKEFISILDGTEEAREINLKYRVEVGNNIFKFTSEDDVVSYIIAENILFKNEVTKYG